MGRSLFTHCDHQVSAFTVSKSALWVFSQTDQGKYRSFSQGKRMRSKPGAEGPDPEVCTHRCYPKPAKERTLEVHERGTVIRRVPE